MISFTEFGTTHLTSKIESAPWVTAPGQWEEGALRWCFYCNNVLGDPAMGIWTTNPINIQANYQSSIQTGTTTINVLVTSSGIPVEGLACVIIKDSLSYGVSYADSAGNAVIYLDPPIAEIGNAELIISGYNCLPTSFPLTITSVQDDVNKFIPLETKLFENYPNPFNPSTNISWQASVAGWQTLKIFDVLGGEVETLVDEFRDAGFNSILYNVNSSLPSGVYYYQLRAGNFIQTNKMVYLK